MSAGRLIDQSTVTALRQHRCYASLCTRLVDAYGGHTQRVMELGEKAGVPAAALTPTAAVIDLWPELLAAALNRGCLVGLVSQVLADTSIGGHHALIRALAELDVAAELEAYVRRIRTVGRQVLAEQYVDLSAAPDRRPRPELLVDDDLQFAAGWDDLPEVEGRYQGAGQQETSLEPVPRVRERLMTVNRCVLLGEPGSGKTWTLSRLLLAYADAWLAAPEEGRDGLPLPVWVPLRRFRGATEAGEAQSLRDYMRSQLGLLAPLWDELQMTQPLVVLLDAFNEMPRTSLTGADLVADVKREISCLPRFVLSCRARDYGNELGDLPDLEQLRLQDLDPPKMLAVIRSRFKDGRAEDLWVKMGGSEDLPRAWDVINARGEDQVKRFWVHDGLGWDDFQARGVHDQAEFQHDWDALQAWRTIHQGARLIPLARNPFLLGNLCRLYGDTGKLPESRADLFAGLTQNLLDNEIKRCTAIKQPWPVDAEDRVIAALTDIALAMQVAKETVIGREAAEAAIAHEDRAWLLGAALDARLLREDGEQVTFEHQLFQEYFAARQLLEDLEAGRRPDGYFQAGEGWWDPHVWRETWVILGELLGDGAAGPNRVARWLAEVSPEVGLEVVLRSGAGFGPQDVEPETRRLLADSAWAKAEEPHPYGRAAAYRVLGILGADDRKGVGVLPPDANGIVLPDIDWVPIPGGLFRYQKGEDAARDVTLPPFKIARYPVTWAQFQAFVDDPQGYADKRWWDGLAKRHATPEDARWPIPNHPREMADWDAAVAFSRWLTVRLRAAGMLGDAEEARLPTEEEWERAARGPEGREYPWGDGYRSGVANIDETGRSGSDKVGQLSLGRTSAVGMYADGATPAPEGVHDMAGNVWEWCMSEFKFELPEHIWPSGSAARVVRGGSWDDDHHDARASYSIMYAPPFRLDLFGFRLVISSPISPVPLAAGAA